MGVAMSVVQVSSMQREIVQEKKMKWNFFITDIVLTLEIVLVIKGSLIQRLGNVEVYYYGIIASVLNRKVSFN